jgi:hypothetical protein
MKKRQKNSKNKPVGKPESQQTKDTLKRSRGRKAKKRFRKERPKTSPKNKVGRPKKSIKPTSNKFGKTHFLNYTRKYYRRKFKTDKELREWVNFNYQNITDSNGEDFKITGSVIKNLLIGYGKIKQRKLKLPQDPLSEYPELPSEYWQLMSDYPDGVEYFDDNNIIEKIALSLSPNIYIGNKFIGFFKGNDSLTFRQVFRKCVSYLDRKRGKVKSPIPYWWVLRFQMNYTMTKFVVYMFLYDHEGNNLTDSGFLNDFLHQGDYNGIDVNELIPVDYKDKPLIIDEPVIEIAPEPAEKEPQQSAEIEKLRIELEKEKEITKRKEIEIEKLKLIIELGKQGWSKDEIKGILG